MTLTRDSAFTYLCIDLTEESVLRNAPAVASTASLERVRLEEGILLKGKGGKPGLG